jgi:hypothetical protein
MGTLIDDVPEAAEWVEQTLSLHSGARAFGKAMSAVIWTSAKGPDGLVVGGDDPSALIDEINSQGLPMFRGHDPGLPVGRTVAAQLFSHSSRAKFVAAILVLYEDDKKLSFRGLNLDPFPPASSPSVLRELDTDTWLEFATDPREVDVQWVEELTSGTLISIKPVELSHNAANAQSELIRIGLVFVALVWNPFVTTIATEAGKSTYAAIHDWLRSLWKRLGDRRNPVVAVQALQSGCEVSFIFRGKDIDMRYLAHEAMSLAAAQATILINSMKNNGTVPVSLVYEFEKSRWFPSYAILDSGQLVSDRGLLIALEQLPKSLSIGIRKQEEAD